MSTPAEPGAEFEAVMAATLGEPADAKAVVAAAAELCVDAASGGVAAADLERWVREWAAKRAAERAKWGFSNPE